VQDFDDEVLKQSGRGYTGELAEQSCRMIREFGLELGIQLMPGLPGPSKESVLENRRRLAQILPKVPQ
jgi:histone acetyltransferase (RNA polymerase elongator complex component)